MSSKTNKLSLIFTAILSFLGFVDSTYLTIVHYKNIIPPCSITQGCEKVLTSQFATILGVPISLLGSLFFLALIFLLLLGLVKYFKLLIFAGVVVAIILLYIQAFVLHAFCQYCLLVEAIILGIFILSYPFNSSSR